jgi:hypothetical protein
MKKELFDSFIVKKITMTFFCSDGDAIRKNNLLLCIQKQTLNNRMNGQDQA